MDDFTYLLSLAFSGADLTRALWLGIIGGLLCSSKFLPSRALIFVIIIDRAWPFIAMALAGHEPRSISNAVAHAITSLPQDIVPLLIRCAGIYGLLAGTYLLRRLIHAPSAKAKA